MNENPLSEVPRIAATVSISLEQFIASMKKVAVVIQRISLLIGNRNKKDFYLVRRKGRDKLVWRKYDKYR